MHNIPKYAFTKYTGSKRYLVQQLRDLFPSNIETYYEPFLGTGIVITAAIGKCKHIIGSDISPYLIGMGKLVKENPNEIFEHYANLGPFSAEKYYEIRERFNATRDPKDFYCLLRTSINGLVRFNNKTNNFNAAFHHHGREGMLPEKVKLLIYSWHEFIKKHNIQLEEKSFEGILDVVTKDDFVFLDPPYKNSGGLYGNVASIQQLETVLESLNKIGARGLMTFDGVINGEDTSYQFDPELYKVHGFFNKAISKGRVEDTRVIQESYYKNY